MIQNKMDFSMYIKRFFEYIGIVALLFGCSSGSQNIDWFDEYDQMTPSTPSVMEYGRISDGYGTSDTSGDTHRMAVLLPLSGDNAAVGRIIRTSVETAVLNSGTKNLTVSFYDSNENLSDTITTILASDPEIVVGPVFANDARTMRDTKPTNLPVLSFTSDATATGNGVMTMALMPTNSVEAIVREMKSDNANQFIILAPDTPSGRLMAGTAKHASKIYDVPVAGIFYYTEHDSESIKNAASNASMYNARTAAHTRARQVLSDILTNERLAAIEESSLTRQLEKLEKSDTLGHVPYDAVLFLGNGDDTKTLASFLRYYDVASRDARFYGTTMWDGSDVLSDFTMSGAKYATLPAIKPEFSLLYEQVSGTLPNRLATFGYDAANMAIGMIYSDKSHASYLLDPSGYMGTDGLFRMKPNGTSERALGIAQLNGTATPKIIKDAPKTFMKPLYNIDQERITPADAMPLETTGIDPDDYITIPNRLYDKYRSKTIGATTKSAPAPQKSKLIAIVADEDDTIKSDDYTPIKLESISRSYIDEYEIEE